MKEVESWKRTLLVALFFGMMMWLFMEFFMYYDTFSERNFWKGFGYWMGCGLFYGVGARYLLPWIENKYSKEK